MIGLFANRAVTIKAPEKYNLQDAFQEISSEPDLKVLRTGSLLADTRVKFRRDEEAPISDLLEAATNLKDATAITFARQYRLSEDNVKANMSVSLILDDYGAGQPVFSIDKTGNAQYDQREWQNALAVSEAGDVELKVLITQNALR